MNIFRSKKLTEILPLLTARYSFLCTRRLQPPHDDYAVRIQWFSSVYILLTEHFPKFGCVVNSRREFVCDVDAESLSLSEI